MRIENGMVVLERKDCYCGDGTQPTPKWKMCTKCKGTGKRGSGRCRECNPREYYGASAKRPGQVLWYDHDDPMPCTACDGNFKDFKAENYTDNLPSSVFTEIPIKVLRSTRPMSWQEQHLGAGVYTIIDYGAHKKVEDGNLIDQVRTSLMTSHVQACKMVKSKDDMTFATELYIVTGDQGYSVVPTWEEENGK